MIRSDEAYIGYEKKKASLIREFKERLQAVSEENGSFSLSKETSNLFRNRKTGRSQKLDVKRLNRVLSIDPENLEADVEAMIPYEALVLETLKFDCLPAVVPQLKTITVGGAVAGLGIESTSFRYGLVHETVYEIEVLTGEGKAIVCRPNNERRDLFYAFPNSYGTLGYALRVKLKLIRAKKFVRLTHFHLREPAQFFDKIRALTAAERALPGESFIDGVIFRENEMAITYGEFADVAPSLSDYTYMDVYYKSISKKKTDFLTTYDYIWRWDADWFWCSKHFGMNHWILRLLLGKWMLHSKVFWKIKRLAASNPLFHALVRLFEKPSESVIQDILIPIEHALSFYEFLRDSIQIAPIWICPFKSFLETSRYTFCPKLEPNILYLDFGFWDILPSDKPKGYYNRLIEKKTEELNGFKSLYSDSYFTEEEFWKIYPKDLILGLKEKYDPGNVFKGLYEKCVRKM